MARGYQFRPQRVLQKARAAMASPLTDTWTAAPWMKAVEKFPPSELLTRPYPAQHQPLDERARRPHNLYRPTKLAYPEDELRQTFYRDHPWELARPMVVLEVDGMDARFRDWSKGLRQPGMQLSGECVVQRQLWLMENEGMTKDEAYDMARREFYALRQQEDIERRIAAEEARMVGAYFGKSLLQVGVELEGKMWENWKAFATKSLATAQANSESESSADLDLPGEEQELLLAKS